MRPLRPFAANPEIIAHRGASHAAPENTLASLNLGWQQGADAGECDIHLTKDGHLVVIHDDDTRRTTGVASKVSQQTLAQLRTLDAGRWKAPKWAGEKIPTLTEALATIPRGKRLFIEIKSGPKSIPVLARTLRHSRVPLKSVVIIGFSLRLLTLAKRALPKVPVYWAADTRRAGRRRVWTIPVEELISRTQRAGLDGLDVDATGPIDAAFVARVHAARLRLCVWTVNTAARARRLAAAGVDGITTDQPGWLREQLR